MKFQGTEEFHALKLHWDATFGSRKLVLHSLNISTTPITTMGCQQCLPFSVVQLKGKHC